MAALNRKLEPLETIRRNLSACLSRNAGGTPMNFPDFTASNWRRTTRKVGVLIGLTALAAVPASQAFANPPTFDTVTINYTVVAPGFSCECGFTVVRHEEGTIRIAVLTD